VQTAIRATGYAPNISARRLAQNKSFTICILMYPGFYQEASEMLSKIMDIGYESNYDIMIQPYFPPHSRSRNKLVSLIYEHRIDGFVITPPCDADEFVSTLLTTYKVPQVQINPINRTSQIPYVAGDDYQGAFSMTEYLIGLGHEKIGFLKGPRNMRASFDRLYGFRAALDSHRIPYCESLIRDSEWTFDGGYAMTKELLLLGQETPTAIFAGSDEAAYGAIYAVQELGMDIPGQISICGYDDISFSKKIWPSLTTVHQPAEENVELAARLLIDILKNEPLKDNKILIPSHLVIRRSTGKAPTA
jgi:LacI family transcriptional regulator